MQRVGRPSPGSVSDKSGQDCALNLSKYRAAEVRVMTLSRAVFMATVLTLLSGAFMVASGIAIANDGFLAGQWIALPAGFIIEGAFIVVQRADRAAGRSRPTISRYIAQRAVALLSGAVMAFAGYCLATWSWLLLGPVSLVGGLVILVAFAIGRGVRMWPPPSPRETIDLRY